ncbi:MAG: ABC transporter ATP-binding protein [Cyclobacteriaceae bacterium]|nr:ABC transporter ATP-binding protein [Cyclobacteriaceae bacterium]
MSFIEVKSISKNFESGLMLDDINFQQQRYQKIAIAGETGSGKSTLLKIIAGLEQPDSGEVWINKERVKGPKDTLVPGHASIAYLSQQFDLPKFLRVEQVLTYANTLSAREARTLYEVCRVDHLVQRKTSELSGGEQQRIALARLLSTKPKLLLLDEPYSNLDRMMRNILKTVLDDIGVRLKITMMLVSHDPADTLSWADDIIVLRAGRIIQQGSPIKIYEQPVDTYTAGLFGAYNLLTTLQQRALGIVNTSPIIRPENLKIVNSGATTVSGTVIQSRFLGDRFDVEVKLKNGVLNVMDEKVFIPGDKVHIRYHRLKR